MSDRFLLGVYTSQSLWPWPNEDVKTKANQIIFKKNSSLFVQLIKADFGWNETITEFVKRTLAGEVTINTDPSARNHNKQMTVISCLYFVFNDVVFSNTFDCKSDYDDSESDNNIDNCDSDDSENNDTIDCETNNDDRCRYETSNDDDADDDGSTNNTYRNDC